MDRMQEYEALLHELEPTPARLEYTVQRAKARRRRRTLRRVLGIPAAGFVGLFAAFVVLVNCSMSFASACSTVPALRELMRAVALSEGLKEAVEHDYFQYIGESQTQSGITITLEYLVLDQGQLHFLVRMEAEKEDMEDELIHLHPNLLDENGEKLPLVTTGHAANPDGSLVDLGSAVTPDGTPFPYPERITLELEPMPENPVDLPDSFVFSIPLNTAALNQRRVLELDRWVEVDGQSLHFVRLECYPSHARLVVEESEENTASLSDLKFWLEDQDGRRYDQAPSGGLSALGTTYWCETPFYQMPEELTLHITQTQWLDHGGAWVTLDLTSGEALDPLPEGVTCYLFPTGDLVEVSLVAPLPEQEEPNHKVYAQISSMQYRTPDGQEHTINRHGVHTAGPVRDWNGNWVELREDYYVETFTLDPAGWDTVELGLHHSRTFDHDPALALSLN